MGASFRAGRCRTILTGASMAAALLGAMPAQAQSAAGGTRLAQLDARHAFDIPEQGLTSALALFGQQSGLQVTVDGALVRGLATAGVRGTMTAGEALRQLLSGTGLSYSVSGGTTVAIQGPGETSSPDGTLRLDPVTVQGQSETAYGPVDGYVATRSGTGTKTDTPLIETPQSVSVVTAEQMKAINATSVTAALGYTPGVSAQSPAFTRMVDDVMIRGFNVASGDTGMLRDGMKLQSNVYDGSQEPYGLERVEVLRGPSSILYGQLSPGGVVNAVTKRPTLTPLHEINLEYGSYDRKQVSADLGGPLTADGAFSYRLTGLVRDAENWVDYVDDDKSYFAGGLTWRPSSATSLTLQGSYQEIHTKFAPPMPYDVLADGTIPRDLFIGEPDYDRYDSTMYTVGYLLEHSFGERLKLRQAMRYYSATVEWDYLSFGTLTGSTLTRGVSDRSEKSTGFTTDTSIEAKVETGPAQHTLLAGLDYYRMTYDRNRFTGSVAPLEDIYNPVYDATPIINPTNIGFNQSGDQLGVYLQDQIKLWDRWVVLLGGRQDWASSEQTSYYTGATTEQDDSALTGRAGLVYLFDNGIAPYVSFSQSFSPNPGADLNGNAFEPTEGTQYELGLRYEPPGMDVLVSAAIYQLIEKNVLTPDPVDPTFSVQTGEVRSRGIELEAKASLGNLNLIGSYAYTDARTTESNDPSEIGERVWLVPYHTLGVWADYGFDDLGVEGLRIGAGVRYASSTNNFDSDEDAPARTLVDALVSYDLGALDPVLEGGALALNASNLFDDEYFTCVTSTGCRYGAPRTITATLSYSW